MIQYLPSADSGNFNDHLNVLHTMASDIFEILVNRCNNLSLKSFREYVREQLYKGGGRLFKYISREDKAFFIG